MRHSLILLFAALLISCGGAPIPTQAQVESALAAAGATNFHEPEAQAGSPLPQSFQVRRAFEVASVAPKGGQFFICQDKRGCDALFAYFDVLKGFGGPYYYQSPSGLVVVQLNSGLRPDEAGKFEVATKSLP